MDLDEPQGEGLPPEQPAGQNPVVPRVEPVESSTPGGCETLQAICELAEGQTGEVSLQVGVASTYLIILYFLLIN